MGTTSCPYLGEESQVPWYTHPLGITPSGYTPTPPLDIPPPQDISIPCTYPHPMLLTPGDHHWKHTHPLLVTLGDQHWKHTNPLPVTPGGHHWKHIHHIPTPLNRMTDTCKNITSLLCFTHCLIHVIVLWPFGYSDSLQGHESCRDNISPMNHPWRTIINLYTRPLAGSKGHPSGTQLFLPKITYKSLFLAFVLSLGQALRLAGPCQWAWHSWMDTAWVISGTLLLETRL